MSFFKQHGTSSLLKEGSSTSEKPVFKNISAVAQLKGSITSCYGPNGLSKLIINAHGKRVVTKDCSIILSEVEIDHPAVSLLQDAAIQQLNETGDGSAAVVLIAGELAIRAERMLRECGIPLADIVNGYRKAISLADALLSHEISLWSRNDSSQKKETLEGERFQHDGLIVCKIRDILNPRNSSIILSLLRSAMDSKLLSVMKSDDIIHLSEIALKACLNVIQQNTDSLGNRAISFNPDHIRVIKLAGGNAMDSTLVTGFIVNHGVEPGTEKRTRSAKIAVYDCAFEPMATETKGNVLFESEEQMVEYGSKEEEKVEALVVKLQQKLGINVVVSTSSFGEIALHFLRKHGLMAVKLAQKHELRRLCVAVGAKPQPRVSQLPSAEDIGYCDLVEEINEIKLDVPTNSQSRKKSVPIVSPIVVFRSALEEETGRKQEILSDCKISTIIVRGYTQPMQEYMQQAFNNAINVFRLLLLQNSSSCTATLNTIDRSNLGGFVVAGGGAFETELSCRLSRNISQGAYSNSSKEKCTEMAELFGKITPIEECVIKEYAEALLVLPCAIAENSGGKSMDTITKLQAAHSQFADKTSSTGRCFTGVDIQNGGTKRMISSTEALNACQLDVLEPLSVKLGALHLATSTMVDILSVDQMIMSKRAGGPKRMQGNSADE
ncbi:T-complex protein 1 theta subunit [Perkinsela sp. CCAP 1560/4]|nr:T-complex protein 1 theta subunit [Perkinsela sp. CCAP 1560/4]|eukprot:KNH05189.1 T-complex protein 1 theta subunit [Perkinsela sp. CCAP 1560/4]